jgi:fructose-1-phosphate kinase PfkB-like protein
MKVRKMMSETVNKTKCDGFLDDTGKNWLRNFLKDQTVIVEFIKIDGTTRKLKCTLSESKIPVDKLPKNVNNVKNDSVLSVFDLEKQDWRSFRWDSVKTIELAVLENQ